MQYSSGNVFRGIPVGPDEASLFAQFLDAHDFAAETRRGFTQDIKKLARWFASANGEPFRVARVTITDVTSFRDFLRRECGQSVATVNRALVTIRRFFHWLVDQGHVSTNPAKQVKELKRQELAPKGLERTHVRRLLRECELRQDIRASAIFHFFLFCGARVSDVANLELPDLLLGERSGTAVLRHGKGRKQRSVPVPLPARRGLLEYLETRPPVECHNVFVGERGPLSDRGIRSLLEKYSTFIGVHLHPHLLRHTFSHQYLADNPGDLVGLAQILGHTNLNTTARYTKKSEKELGDASDRLSY